jgi:hypothetical protein
MFVVVDMVASERANRRVRTCIRMSRVNKHCSSSPLKQVVCYEISLVIIESTVREIIGSSCLDPSAINRVRDNGQSLFVSLCT